jgi:hypothetical protein
MAERSRQRRFRLALLVALLTGAACGSDVESRARLLDDECKRAVCPVQGNAEEVTGITADSVGFRLGPGVGKVTIPLSTFTTAGDDSFSVELLIAGEGGYQARLLRETCGDSGTCSGLQIISEISGRATDEPGWRNAGTYSGDADTFSNFVVELESDPGAEEIQLIDIRYDTFDTVECSVRAPGRR